ncbi:MAG: SanA/YdcF family protein [Eggerthellaceae bacterium]|jgi:SanA protein
MRGELKTRRLCYYQRMRNAVSTFFRILLRILLVFIIIVAVVLLVPNAVEIIGQSGNIKTEEELANSNQSYDCILVLGAAVNADGTPTTMLADRLDVAVELYNDGVAPKIIMSGDDKSDLSYDEVEAMKEYVVDKGVPSENVFCDHAGICTYDSMYRALNVFQVSSMVVVTQEYHLSRALYDANSLGIQTVGVSASLHTYDNQDYYDQREFFARVSDFRKVLMKEKSTYLSEPVSLDQSGDVTTW